MREIIGKVPKDPKGHGRKRKKENCDQLQVNWKNPLVFALIREAQHEIKRVSLNEEWSPVAIVKQ
jgi:hypothetical protein